MPILEIEIVGARSEFSDSIAQEIADAAGEMLDSRPQGTWVKLRFLPRANYAENGGSDQALRPVFIKLLVADTETLNLKTTCRNLADGISKILHVPAENVHILVEPAARGRIAFGGDLLE